MTLSVNQTWTERLLVILSSRETSLNMETADVLLPSTSKGGYLSYNSMSDLESRDTNATNWTSTNETSHDMFERNEELWRAEISVLAAILYLAIFGNGVVLLVLRLRRQKMTRMHWFIVHLTIADLFVAIFHILPQLVWEITVQFYGNDFLCRAVTYFQVVAMYASSYVLVMTAVDRYLSICHPLTSHTLSPKRVHLMIALAWCLSLLFSLPQVFIFQLKEGGEDTYQCYGEFEPGWGVQAYVTWIFVSDYALPFLILAFCYGRICHVVWTSVKSKESCICSPISKGTHESSERAFTMHIPFLWTLNKSSLSLQSQDRVESASINTCSNVQVARGHQRAVSRSTIKTVKLTLTVVLCYLCCWAPFFVVQMWTAFREEDLDLLEKPVVVIIMLLASLNSCTNPWIYLVFSGLSCLPSHSDSRASRSWGHSTHVTSTGDIFETKKQTSFINCSQAKPSSRQNSPTFVERKEKYIYR